MRLKSDLGFMSEALLHRCVYSVFTDSDSEIIHDEFGKECEY